jgi:HK97 family phage major capsid protein
MLGDCRAHTNRAIAVVTSIESSPNSTALRAKHALIIQYAHDLDRRGHTARARHARAELRRIDGQLGQLTDDSVDDLRQLPEDVAYTPAPVIAKRAAVGSVSEPATYRRGDSRRSYMQDLIKMSLNMDDTGGARERLMRHAQDVATDPEYAEYRDLSRVDGQGGYAIPPAWLMSQYIELARPGRAFANLVQRQPLPAGTDSINIPKLLTGTQTAVQNGDNTAIADVDLTDTFINAPVRTIAGAQGVAIQLIDQSPIAFDDVVFRDLVADHAAQTDKQTLSGSGTGGQVLGLRLTPNIGSVAASAVTTAGVYSAIANAIQTVHTTRLLPPEVIVMHPRRWGWFLSLLDGQQRPLFLPSANNPQNAGGILSDVASQQVVGQMHGLPVVTDPNIETNLGGATNEDPIYVLRASDIVLWESGVKARVLPETKAATLTVLLQIFSYLAFTASRFPQSIVAISGLSAPAF